MSVCCEWTVLSGRGLCDELITRPEESYRLWRVVVCDQETSWMRRPRPAFGCRTMRNKQHITCSYRSKNISKTRPVWNTAWTASDCILCSYVETPFSLVLLLDYVSVWGRTLYIFVRWILLFSLYMSQSHALLPEPVGVMVPVTSRIMVTANSETCVRF
jgi:hypothetical protein